MRIEDDQVKIELRTVYASSGPSPVVFTVGEEEDTWCPGTTAEALSGLKPVFKNGMRIQEGRFITAGNASQLSDGASASVLMEASEAERRGLRPHLRFGRVFHQPPDVIERRFLGA